MKNQSVNYQASKFLADSTSIEKQFSSLLAKVGRILFKLVELMTAVNDPKIYSLKSKSGKAYWVIHDPYSGRRVTFHSETEVREWLDRRYYRQPQR
jgi:hypothetical protein